MIILTIGDVVVKGENLANFLGDARAKGIDDVTIYRDGKPFRFAQCHGIWKRVNVEGQDRTPIGEPQKRVGKVYLSGWTSRSQMRARRY